VATLRAYPSGDGTLFVSDQIGIIYRISQGKLDTFFNIRSIIKDFIYEPGIGTGLGSFAFHPDFLHNGLFYTTHAEGFKGLPADNGFSDSLKIGLQWVLTEWKMTDVRAKTFQGTHRELLRLNTPTTAHGVQDIGFVPGLNKKDPGYGMLYLGCGDGGSNNIRHPELSHTTSSFLGTIIRIDPAGRNSPNGKYGIPADNPFVTDKNPATRKEIWAYGFRNPHRMCWDLSYGVRMIAADIGESNIEEVNIIEKGGDYGWSRREGNYAISTKIDLKNVYPVRQDDTTRYRGPFGQYDHNDGNAISGGFVYHGPLTSLDNKYIFGDIVQGKLFYLNIDRNLTDSTVYELTVEQNGKETSLRQLNNIQRVHLRIGYDPFSGTLYIMTKNGKIRRVTKAFYKGAAPLNEGTPHKDNTQPNASSAH
jgi:glucose/arabinose dehydrogenase